VTHTESNSAPRQAAGTSKSPSSRTGKGTALAALCLAFFIVMLDTTIVNIALPAIRDDFAGGVRLQQWVVDSYTLVFAALLLTAGAVSDVIGPRRVFEFGLVAFAVFSAACAVSPTGIVLVIARAFQGIGAAALVPASLALIGATYPDPAARSRAIGIWGGMGGIAAAVGPVAGGVLIAATGWQAVFVVNVPVAVVAYVLIRRAVPDIRPSGRRSLDPAGQILAIASLFLLTYAIIDGGGRHGWGAGDLGLLVAGLVLFVVFVVVQRRRGDRAMLPVGLFASPVFSAASATGMLLNLGFYGQFFVLTLYLQQLRHFSAISAAGVLAAEAVGAIIGSPLGGRIAARIGTRITMMIGLAIGSVGFAGLLPVGAHTGYLLIVPTAFLAGLGMSTAMPAATAAAIGAAPAERSGVAAGVVNTARQFGSVLGVAVLGAFVAEGKAFLPGFHLAIACSVGIFLLGVLLHLFVRPALAPRPAA